MNEQKPRKYNKLCWSAPYGAGGAKQGCRTAWFSSWCLYKSYIPKMEGHFVVRPAKPVRSDCTRLIRALLAFSRLENGRLPTQMMRPSKCVMTYTEVNRTDSLTSHAEFKKYTADRTVMVKLNRIPLIHCLPPVLSLFENLYCKCSIL